MALLISLNVLRLETVVLIQIAVVFIIKVLRAITSMQSFVSQGCYDSVIEWAALGTEMHCLRVLKAECHHATVRVSKSHFL